MRKNQDRSNASLLGLNPEAKPNGHGGHDGRHGGHDAGVPMGCTPTLKQWVYVKDNSLCENGFKLELDCISSMSYVEVL